MGAVERHYLRRNNVLFIQEEEFRPSRKGSDDKIVLPTLSTRYQSPYYIESAQKNKTQVVVKIVSRASGATCVNRLGDYIARDISVEDSKIMGKEGHDVDKNEYLYLEDENGIIYNSKDERRELIKEWSADFKGQQAYKNQEWKDERIAQMKQELSNVQALFVAGRQSKADKERLDSLQQNIKKKQYKTKEGKVYDLNVYLPKDTTHMVLSVGGQPKNKRELQKANEAVRNYLNKNLGDLGHRYLFTPHNDTDNLHYHVIIKNSNEFDKKMLRFDKADLFMLRQSFAKELEQSGFERGAELRKDREVTLEKVAKGIERLHENQTWYQNLLAKDTSPTFDAFEYRARALRNMKFLSNALKAEGRHLSFFNFKDQFAYQRSMKALNSFRTQLQKVKPAELSENKEALSKLLSKDSKILSSKINQIKSYASYDELNPVLIAKRNKNIEATSLYISAHQENLKAAFSKVKDKQYESYFKGLFQAANRNYDALQAIKASKKKALDKGKGRGI